VDASIFWEDFKPGERVEIGSTVVDRAEVIDFARRYDPQPFHIDDTAAKNSIYGGIIASGWHTCSMVMRLMCDAYLNKSASIGSPGLENIKWIKPVRPGDRITAFRSTLDSRISKSRPEVGIVRNLWEVFNQDGDLVMTMEGYGMFYRRDKGETQA
jgi:acyl dehydratase